MKESLKMTNFPGRASCCMTTGIYTLAISRMARRTAVVNSSTHKPGTIIMVISGRINGRVLGRCSIPTETFTRGTGLQTKRVAKESKE